MQKIEFTQRTGIELTDEQYKQVEDMYLEAGNVDKDQFCKDYKKHSDSEILKLFYCQNEKLKNKLADLRDERNEIVDFLLNRAQEFGDIKLLEKAICMVGHDKVIKRKISQNLPLWDIDKKYIYENIK